MLVDSKAEQMGNNAEILKLKNRLQHGKIHVPNSASTDNVIDLNVKIHPNCAHQDVLKAAQNAGYNKTLV